MRNKTYLILLLLTFSMFLSIGTVNSEQTKVSMAAVNPDQSPKIEFRGLAYGPFRGVGPDRTEIVTKANVEEDMQIMKDLGVNHIRTYGIGLGLNQIPFIAAQYGINTATGTWIHTGNADNFGEIDTALAAESVSSMVIVGNEVLTGSVGFTEQELVGFIEYAQNKRENSSFPIATAEEWGFFAKNNSLTLELERTAVGNATDVIIMHAHPVWHKVPLAEAANWTIDKYFEVANLYPEKRVILGETGWPSDSTPSNSLFTEENQKKYVEDILALIDQYDIESYLFAAFDENWKLETYEGQYDIGPYWGFIEEERYGKNSSTVIAEYFGGTISTDPPDPIEPVINNPDDMILDIGEEDSISWTITDEDTAEGTYNITRNNVVQGVAGLTWKSGIPINWNVDTSTAGEFTYKISFTDGEFDKEDIVIVTVGSVESSSDPAEFNSIGFFVVLIALAVYSNRFMSPLKRIVK